MQYAEAVMALRSVPLFAKLDPAKLKLLAFSSAHLTFEPGEALFHEGDPADAAYLIDEGEADVLIASDRGEVKVGSLGRHQLIGEMAIFLNAPRSATIRAAGRLKVLKIERDVFLGVVTGNPDAALAVMRSLSEKLAQITERYERLLGRGCQPP